jgi:hypothetical protein
MHTPKPLVACSSCGCHHRAGETACPHCGSAPPVGRRAASALVLGLAVAAGCTAGGGAVAMYGVAITGPIVTITSPADGDTVAAGDLEVDATVSDSQVSDLTTVTVAWTVDGDAACADAAVDASGATSCTATLDEGDHTIAVSGTDPTGDPGMGASITVHAAADTGS